MTNMILLLSHSEEFSVDSVAGYRRIGAQGAINVIRRSLSVVVLAPPRGGVESNRPIVDGQTFEEYNLIIIHRADLVM